MTYERSFPQATGVCGDVANIRAEGGLKDVEANRHSPVGGDIGAGTPRRGGHGRHGTLDEFGAWAWERHHNVLSWYIRPLFFLPFCYFAYRRSLSGMILTLVALATSMFWFPAPERSDPMTLEFLAVEREYLTGDWTTAKVLMASLVPISFAALGLVFWKRSIVYGLVLMNAVVLIKSRVEFLLRGRVGGANLAAFRHRGSGGLRRGDPVRRAQDAHEIFAHIPAAGRPAWRLGLPRSLAGSMPAPTVHPTILYVSNG